MLYCHIAGNSHYIYLWPTDNTNTLQSCMEMVTASVDHALLQGIYFGGEGGMNLGIGLITGTINCKFCDLCHNRNT